ncbi:hypothetical protein [Actinoplanes sp. NPDC051494]|uniref:hypothetical protein n=1 Tax=Actinoplanes sp. NPDC051494 TaxID=3363907 RepID=UPI0037AD1D31
MTTGLATITTAAVSITLTVDGISKTFTGSVTTDGDPGNAIRGVLQAIEQDATNWTFKPLREALRDQH